MKTNDMALFDIVRADEAAAGRNPHWPYLLFWRGRRSFRRQPRPTPRRWFGIVGAIAAIVFSVATGFGQSPRETVENTGTENKKFAETNS